MNKRSAIVASLAAVLAAGCCCFGGKTAAAPARVLVFDRTEGFNHKAGIAAANEALKAWGASNRIEVVITQDYACFTGTNLSGFAAVVLNNSTHVNTKKNPEFAPTLLAFVRAGGGLAVLHAGADSFYDAKDVAMAIGGRFDGHPWVANGTWAFKVEDTKSPIDASFTNPTFKFSDEIYQQSSPYYNRATCHVLVSLDRSDKATDTANVSKQKRADKDNAVSWIRTEGKGRVFYTSFGHDARAYKNPEITAHILAGVAYVLGRD